MWTQLKWDRIIFRWDLYSILLEENSTHSFDPVSDFFVSLKDFQTLHNLNKFYSTVQI